MHILRTLKPCRPQGIFYPYMQDISPYMERNDDRSGLYHHDDQQCKLKFSKYVFQQNIIFSI